MSHETKPECAGYLMLREKYIYIISNPIHRASCHGEAEWEIEGKHYCLMHAPTKDKAEEFERALQEKLAHKDYNFCGAWFPEGVDFDTYNFAGEVNFHLAVFNGYASFSEARFREGGAHFSGAQFSGGSAYFYKAEFSGGKTTFSSAQFSGGEAYFGGAQFSGGEAYFRGVQFSGGSADFSEAQFGGDAYFYKAKFSGGDADFSYAQFSGRKANFKEARFGHFALFEGTKFDNADTDFREVRFGSAEIEGKQDPGGASFEKAEFNIGPVNFYSAQFIGGDARFDHAKFLGGNANFRRTVFEKTARFDHAEFAHRASFSNATFQGSAIFDEIQLLAGAMMESRLARFTDFTRFSNLKIENGAEFYFGETTFEKPEHVHFLSIENLQPRWFIKTDMQKFIFDDVGFPNLNKPDKVEHELDMASKLMIDIARHASHLDDPKHMDAPKGPPYKLLITAYHRLAANAEESNRYRDASSFRKLAFETERSERAVRRSEWRKKLKKSRPFGLILRLFSPYARQSLSSLRELAREYPSGVLQFLYRWLSGYSENWAWTFFFLILIWLGFGVFYGLLWQSFEPALNPWDLSALSYSLLVMALQRPEPKAIWPLTKFLIGLQIIFTTIQAALLVLAIRRKFMR